MRSRTSSRVSLPTSHSSIASTARHVAFGPRRGRDPQQADSTASCVDAQRLEHAVRRVLEHVGEHAVAVEHPQHAVDLGRDLLAEHLDARDVLLEDHRRRQPAARVAHAREEPLGVGEQLVALERDLLPPHDVLVMEVEPRIGPQQELVQRGLAVDHADLRRRDLAVIEAHLAAAQAADQREDRAAAERGERAHQREHAGGLGEAADDVGAVGRGLPAQQSADRDDITQVGRLQHDLVGPGRLGIGAPDAAPGEHDRRVDVRGLEQVARAADQIERSVVGATDHDQPGVVPRDLELGRIERDRRDLGRDPFSLETELNLAARAAVRIQHDDFRESRHASRKSVQYKRR